MSTTELETAFTENTDLLNNDSYSSSSFEIGDIPEQDAFYGHATILGYSSSIIFIPKNNKNNEEFIHKEGGNKRFIFTRKTEPCWTPSNSKKFYENIKRISTKPSISIKKSKFNTTKLTGFLISSKKLPQSNYIPNNQVCNLTQEYDVFHFSNSKNIHNDFIVPGEKLVYGSIRDCFTLRNKNAVIQKSEKFKSKSHEKRYPVRILGNRNNPNDIRVCAGALESIKHVVNNRSKTLIWQNPMYESEEEYDGFIENTSILMFKPNEKMWVEVSIMGNIYSLRPNSTTRGDYIPHLENTLENGSLLYVTGMIFQWSTCINHPSEEVITDSVISLSKSWICPVTFEAIPNRDLCCSIKSINLEFEKKRSKRLLVRFSKSLKERLGLKFKEKSIHELEKQDSFRLTARPWFFTACGHVLSMYDSEIATRTKTNCSVCRTLSDFKPLIVKSVSGLILGNITHAIDPCGHALDLNAVETWGPVNGSPVPKRLIKSKTHIIDKNPDRWGYCCPFCRREINGIRRLFWQDDLY